MWPPATLARVVTRGGTSHDKGGTPSKSKRGLEMRVQLGHHREMVRQGPRQTGVRKPGAVCCWMRKGSDVRGREMMGMRNTGPTGRTAAGLPRKPSAV